MKLSLIPHVGRKLVKSITVEQTTDSIDITGLDILSDKAYTLIVTPISSDVISYYIFVNNDTNDANYAGLDINIVAGDGGDVIAEDNNFIMYQDSGVPCYIDIFRGPTGVVSMKYFKLATSYAHIGNIITTVTHSNVTSIKLRTVVPPPDVPPFEAGTEILVYAWL